MKMCMPHWNQMREAVEERGMSHLVSRSGKEVVDRAVAELEGNFDHDGWDPLMAMNYNFWEAALRLGGLGMMTEPPEGEGNVDDEGHRHYCPLCEAKKRGEIADMDQSWIRDCADAMLAHAREAGLVPHQQ